eukprot:scaffold557_cov172-Ochromonas_danica.AAC.2
MLPRVIAIEYKQRDHIVKVSHERQDVVLGKAKGHEGEEDKRPVVEDLYHFYYMIKWNDNCTAQPVVAARYACYSFTVALHLLRWSCAACFDGQIGIIFGSSLRTCLSVSAMTSSAS